MFVGREEELRTLEKLYAKGSFQLIVMYGRRRVGKTTLINKFIEDKMEKWIWWCKRDRKAD